MLQLKKITFTSLRSIIFLILLLNIALVNIAQTPDKQGWKSLIIGDTVPDFYIPEINNYPKKTEHFRSFKDKLIILDFWATYCEGCIEALPKLASLQKHFGSNIQILLVNQQTREQLSKIISAGDKWLPAYRDALSSLTYITRDSVLSTFFPHYFIPHEVWINPKGKVIAITEGRHVTEENIRLALKNSTASLPEKKDFLAQDVSIPLLPQIFELYNDKLTYYSCLLKYIQGIKPGAISDIDTVRKISRITRPASPILDLYTDALTKSACFNNPFEDPYFDYGKRVILEINDSSRYFYKSSTSYDDWQLANCFVYEAVFPLSEKGQEYDHMLADLNRFFEMDGKIEKRKMKCLALERSGYAQRFVYQGDSSIDGARRYFDSAGVFHIKATVFDSFRETLAEFNKNNPLPIINKIDYPGWIDLSISSPLNNIPMLRKELMEKYDLTITETETEVDVMVLRENNYKEKENNGKDSH